MQVTDTPQTRIRELREKAGLRDYELAVRLGVNPNTVGRWERGEAEPRKHHRERMCVLFGVDAAYLMGWRDDNPLAAEVAA